MKCPKCQHENPDDAKFCNECATKLELLCPECGKVNPPGSKFCNECAHDLGKPEDATPLDYCKPESYTPRFLADKILTSRSSIEGERKLVTVLFADVVNYTALSEELDPEEVHQIMDGCFKILMDEIHKYEGTINQFTGDGVMALFGAPVAHEEHAQRACHAALSIQRAMGAYGEKVKKDTGVDFKMRIGLNSGPVIVGSIGDDLRMDYTAIGDTTNLAARIQQIAKPAEVWMSQETKNIIRDYFYDKPVGEVSLKGKAQPQPIYRLVSERKEVRTRFEAGLIRGVTELVGRRPEMEALRSAFERAKSCEAHVVDVVGEAGVGKSRLIYEFQTTLEEEATFLTGFCVHYGRNMNFLPVIDVVRAAFDIEEGMTEEEASRRVEDKATGELAAMIPFYLNLLSLTFEDQRFYSLNTEGRKFGTFEAVKKLLFAFSEDKPLLIFLEDVHWIDKISEEFFTYFSRSFVDRAILMLTAYRPEGSPSWAHGAHYQRLGLETLSGKSSVRLVRNIVGGLEVDRSLEERIVEKTGGNPFFVEEIMRELLERGDLVKTGDRYVCARPIDQCEIPNTVQGVLAARMDRLSEDLKRTMQVASVIGRDFAFRLLKSIMELGEELRAHLTNLVGLEILYEKALYPELEYIFKHALTQEVAYESLLKQRRREIHALIAQAIEELHAIHLEEHYELLAHHYERSGNSAKAVEYLGLAGKKSNKHGSAESAREFFHRALEISARTHTPLDARKEVRLHVGYARASHGIGAIGEAKKAYRKVLEISQQHGMINYEKESLNALVTFSYMTPDREEADRFLEQAFTRSIAIEDKGLESLIQSMRGLIAAIYGRPYQGKQIVLDTERVALESRDPVSIFSYRICRSFIERWTGRPSVSIELTEGIIEIVRQMYHLSFLTYLIYCRGIALLETGRIEDGMRLIREGIDRSEEFGVLHHHGALYNCLGYCYGEVHHPQRAFEFNTRSYEIARKQMEQYPEGIRQYAEIAAQANVNLMENLFYQGKLDEAWNRMKSFEGESKGEEYDVLRHQWGCRMNHLAVQILLARNDLDQAEAIIRQNLKRVKDLHAKKREGSFLRLLGEVHIGRSQPGSAIDHLWESVEILKEVGNPRQLWLAHSSLASAFNKLKRLSEAQEQWGAAAEVIRNMARGLSDRELREGFLAADQIREILSKAGC